MLGADAVAPRARRRALLSRMRRDGSARSTTPAAATRSISRSPRSARLIARHAAPLRARSASTASASISRRSSAAPPRLRSRRADLRRDRRRSAARRPRADRRAVGHRPGRLSARPLSRPTWLEWNDRYRDDVRRFWRGDGACVGALATRLAGSADIFGERRQPRARSTSSPRMTASRLADLVAYAHSTTRPTARHNRDGHDENLSWNNGVEGADRRRRDPRRAATRRAARCSPRCSPRAARSC